MHQRFPSLPLPSLSLSPLLSLPSFPFSPQIQWNGSSDMSDSESSGGASSASSTSTQWPSQSSYYSSQSINNAEEQTFHFQQILNRAMDENNFEFEQPELDGANERQGDVKEAILKAAQLLHSCEVLLLVTGAGFSADSGLATYIDVADIDAYRERCWSSNYSILGLSMV